MPRDNLQTPRTKVKRQPSRGLYSREEIYAILDSSFLCHVAFSIDGKPHLIPTAYGRKGEYLYIHGSVKSRMLTHLSDGAGVCVSVTILDGIVLARSIFHHSMNYRSVVIYSNGELVTDEDEKLQGLKVITEQIIPGRWDEARQPSPGEMKATSLIRFAINEASAKVRSGPPKDNTEDYDLNVWAGLLPLHLQTGTVVTDPDMRFDLSIPESVRRWAGKQ